MFTPGFSGVRVAPPLFFCVVFRRSLFVSLSLFFRPFPVLSVLHRSLRGRDRMVVGPY